MELYLGRIINIRWNTGSCGALLLAAAEMFNCGMRILGISCDSKTSADSLSLLKFVVLLILANRIHVND